MAILAKIAIFDNFLIWIALPLAEILRLDLLL